MSGDSPNDRRGAVREWREGDEPTLRGVESSTEVGIGLVVVVLPSTDHDGSRAPGQN